MILSYTGNFWIKGGFRLCDCVHDVDDVDVKFEFEN